MQQNNQELWKITKDLTHAKGRGGKEKEEEKHI